MQDQLNQTTDKGQALFQPFNHGIKKYFLGLNLLLKPLKLFFQNLSQKKMFELSAGRGPFIDQSQSLNWWVSEPTTDRLTSMHMYTWKLGLKTGMYYLRRETEVDAQQFTVVPPRSKATTVDEISAEESSNGEESGSGSGSGGGNDTKTGSTPKLCLISDPDCLACQG